VLGFGLGGTLACLAAVNSLVDCAVAYGPVALDTALAGEGPGRTPVVLHFGARRLGGRAALLRGREGAEGPRRAADGDARAMLPADAEAGEG